MSKDYQRIEGLQSSPIGDWLMEEINATSYLQDADKERNDHLLSHIECSIDPTGQDEKTGEFDESLPLLLTTIECPFSYAEIMTFMKENDLMP